MILTPAERATALAQSIEAHYKTGDLPGLTRMIELTIQAAVDDHRWHLPIGSMSLALCPATQRTCPFPQLCDGVCKLRCGHTRTMFAVVGNTPNARAQTQCIDCGAVIP
jgi:hypothetical protein